MKRRDKQLPRPALEHLARIAHESAGKMMRAAYGGMSHEQRLHNRGFIRVWSSPEGSFCALTTEGTRYLKGAR